MGNNSEFTTDMIIQYSIIGAILLGAFAWIVWKMIRKSKGKDSGCSCGCCQSESCLKKDIKSHKTDNCADKNFK